MRREGVRTEAEIEGKGKEGGLIAMPNEEAGRTKRAIRGARGSSERSRTCVAWRHKRTHAHAYVHARERGNTRRCLRTHTGIVTSPL